MISVVQQGRSRREEENEHVSRDTTLGTLKLPSYLILPPYQEGGRILSLLR